MTFPFVIWTMRRTGGTSFANAIKKIGGYNVEHEPFNWNRSFGSMAKEFQNDRKNHDALSQSLSNSCIAEKISLKHCYEVTGNVLNQSLIELFTEAGYKQIIWSRNNELLRILSLFTAKQTSAWGKHGSQDIYERYLSGDLKLEPYNIDEMKSHFEMCKKTTQSVQETVRSSGADFKKLSYEDLYTGSWEDRQNLMESICRWLEVKPESIELGLNDCKFDLMSAKQDSSSIYSLIPNLDEILLEFSDFKLDALQS